MKRKKISASAASELMKEIDGKIGEVRTDSFDMTFGEIINLKINDEIVINPDFQRLFRWSDEQKSRLIESILLRLPIPPVFFIEIENGKLELIDGLQRISSIIQFVDNSLIELEPLELTGCEIIKPLDGFSFKNLPLKLQLQLKRSSVRAIIIQRQSKSFLRYEMFKRLNTGGSLLSPQEIRNCSARLIGERGRQFYEWIIELSRWPSFVEATELLADADRERRGDEELVLRFFAARNGIEFYAGHVADWLDAYMEAILLNRIPFDQEKETSVFKGTFDQISSILGKSAFCKYQENQPVGGLAPAHYEAIAIGFSKKRVAVSKLDRARLKKKIVATKQSRKFRENVGAGANNKTKLHGRISVIVDAIEELT